MCYAFRNAVCMEQKRDKIAIGIIDALGGTAAVARMMDAPFTTVHSWRYFGIPKSRLAHLKLLAESRDASIPHLTDAPEQGAQAAA